jgi:hypothetical protein
MVKEGFLAESAHITELCDEAEGMKILTKVRTPSTVHTETLSATHTHPPPLIRNPLRHTHTLLR